MPEAKTLNVGESPRPVPYAPTYRWVCALIAAGGVVLRAIIALRPIDLVDRLFIPDDTYYTLSIARSLAQGLGPSADGVHLTNGFQPLIAFIMVPFLRWVHDPDQILRIDLLLLALFDGALAFLLGELARRAARRQPEAAAVAATALWAISPVAISYALGGLETTLGLMMACAATLSWCQARQWEEQARASGEGGVGLGWMGWGAGKRYFATGVLCGLGLMARIDVGILVAILGLGELARGRRGGALWVAAGGALALLPWWSYELLRFHSVFPSSGKAVHQLMVTWRNDDRWPFTNAELEAVSLGAVLEAAVGRALDLRLYFTTHGTLGVFLTPVVVLLIIAGIVFWMRRTPEAWPVTVLVAQGLVLWACYLSYTPQYPFFARYLSPVHLGVTLLMAMGIAQLADRAGGMPRHVLLGWATSAAVFAYERPLSRLLFFSPERSADNWVQGIKGYRMGERQILSMAPRGAVIAAFQTGALSYYAPVDRPDVGIVNLDGVVDSEAGEALKNHTMAAFARSRGVTYLADWLFNLESFIRFSGDPLVKVGSLLDLGFAEAPGHEGDAVHLDQIFWPTLAPPGGGVTAVRHPHSDQTDVLAVDRTGALAGWWVSDGTWRGPRMVSRPGRFAPGASLAFAAGVPRGNDTIFAVDSGGSLAGAQLPAWSEPVRVGPLGRFVPTGGVAAVHPDGSENALIFSVDGQGVLDAVVLQPSRSWEEAQVVPLGHHLPAGARLAAVNLGAPDPRVGIFGVDSTGALAVVWTRAGEAHDEPQALTEPNLFRPGAPIAAAVRPGSDQVLVFAVDDQGSLRQVTLDRAGHSPPSLIGAAGVFPPGTPVAAGAVGNGRELTLAVVDKTGTVHIARSKGPDGWTDLAPVGSEVFLPGGVLMVTEEYGREGQADILGVDQLGKVDVSWFAEGKWNGPNPVF